MREILIIEDDEMLNAGLCYNLQMAGLTAIPVYTCSQAEKILSKQDVSCILLDVNLPDGNGFELAEKIRRKMGVPIIFLTANDMDEDMIRGFEAGGDDYITKPFNVKVLIKRVEAILKRCEEKEQKTICCGNLEIDFPGQILKRSGETIILTPTEWKLLLKLSSNPRQVLTRQMLLENLWDGDGNFVDEHTLTIFVSRLRAKINDGKFTYIKTIYGTGYMWTGEKNE